MEKIFNDKFETYNESKTIAPTFKEYPKTFKNVKRLTYVCKHSVCPMEDFLDFIIIHLTEHPSTRYVVITHLSKHLDAIGRPVNDMRNITIKAEKFTRQSLNDLSKSRYDELFGEDYEPEVQIYGDAIMTTAVTFWMPLPGGYHTEIRKTIVVKNHTYEVTSAEHEPNECFWGILLTVFSGPTIDLIKRLSRYQPNTKVSLCYARDIIETMNRCNLEISLKMPDLLIGEGPPIRCMLYEEHYWVIDRLTPHEGARWLIDEDSRKYFTYDFETVSAGGRTYPYIFSYATETESGTLHTCDPINDPLSIPITETFIRLCLIEQRRPVSFNGSNFDDMLLFRELPSDAVRACKGEGNSILWFTCYGKKSLDIARFVKTSLEKACTAFGVEGKFGAPDFDALNDRFDRTGLVTVTREMLEYAEQDSRCLYDLTTKLASLFSTLNINIFGNISIAQCAMRLMRKANGTLWQIKDPELHQFVRSFMIGGKCHANVGIHNFGPSKLCKLFDVNSLYPYVMTKGVFIREASEFGPCSDVVWHGLYVVLVTKQAKVVTLAKRGETLDWDPPVPYVTKCMGVSLADHVKYGGTYELIEGYKFHTVTTSSRMFDWMSDLIKLKQDAVDPCMRNMYKLMINSMSGKLTQAPITDQVRFSKSVGDAMIDEFKEIDVGMYAMRSKLEVPMYTGSLLNGMLVYEYARAELNRYIYEADDFYYCDTDSLFTTSDVKVSDGLGEMKLEAVGDRFYCNGKKSYVLMYADKPVKVSMKGFGPKGYYADDAEMSQNWEWIVRSVGKDEVKISYKYCERHGMMPNFKDLEKVYKNHL